jgi:hypothetical protein
VQQYAYTTGMVLDQGRKVFVYSGTNDFVCNYIGVSRVGECHRMEK